MSKEQNHDSSTPVLVPSTPPLEPIVPAMIPLDYPDVDKTHLYVALAIFVILVLITMIILASYRVSY